MLVVATQCFNTHHKAIEGSFKRLAELRWNGVKRVYKMTFDHFFDELLVSGDDGRRASRKRAYRLGAGLESLGLLNDPIEEVSRVADKHEHAR